MSDDALKKLEKRFEGLIDLIQRARQKADADEILPLETLDRDVNALCEDVEKAETQVAKQTQPLMATLITELDNLAQSLVAYQARVKDKG